MGERGSPNNRQAALDLTLKLLQPASGYDWIRGCATMVVFQNDGLFALRIPKPINP